MENSSSIEEYIANSPEEVRPILTEMRAFIKSLVPEAGEKIAYGIPTFTLNGNLVHFAGYKHHIGFYPGASGVENFKNELDGYQLSRGTIQFPLDKPIPYDLIRRIVEFRVRENQQKKARPKK